MSRIAIVTLLSAIAFARLSAAPATVEACSLVSDYSDPPAVELPFDEQLAPATPVIARADIIHYRESGCSGVQSSCGDYSGLALDIQVETAEEFPILRIRELDGTEVYATSFVGDDGIMRLFLPGYDDVGAELEIQIVLFDAAGHPSLPVTGLALDPDRESDGCTVGGGPSLGALLLLALLATRVRHRQPLA